MSDPFPRAYTPTCAVSPIPDLLQKPAVRHLPAAEPTHEVMVPADFLIPITQLELGIAPPSCGAWRVFLGANGITVLVDDVGRDAISRADDPASLHQTPRSCPATRSGGTAGDRARPAVDARS